MPTDETLHEVTEVAVIKHRDLGVLLLHSTDRRWHFPDCTLRVGRGWDESLRQAVRLATDIEDLQIGPVLLIQNFGPGEVDERPQFGIFFLCTTRTPGVRDTFAHRWIKGSADLDGMELFHPLVADLIGRAQDDSGTGLLRWPTWVGVVVENLDAQRRFWGDLLGEPDSDPGSDLVQFDMGDGRSFELIERSKEPQYDRVRFQVGFEVEDIQSVRDELIGRGVKPPYCTQHSFEELDVLLQADIICWQTRPVRRLCCCL